MKNKIFAVFSSFIAILPFYSLGIMLLVPTDELLIILAIFFGMYFWGLFLGSVIKKEPILSIVAGAFSAAVMCGVVLAISSGFAMLSMLAHLLCGGLSFVPFILGRSIARRPWYEAVVPATNVVMLFSNAAILFFVNAIWPFGDWTWFYNGSVILSAILSVYSMNKANIEGQLYRTTRFAASKDKPKQISLKQNALSPALRRHNRMIISSIFVLIILLTPLLGFGLSSAGKALVTALNTRPEEIERGEPVSSPYPDDFEVVVAEEPQQYNKAFEDISNRFFAVLVSLISVLFIGVLLIKGKNWILELFRNGRVFQKNRRRKHDREEAQIYEEEIEELESGGLTLEKIKDFFRETIGFSIMKNEEERIRYLFRRTVRRGISRGLTPSPASTPRELIGSLTASKRTSLNPKAAETLLKAYESTRYDHTPPPEGTAAGLREVLK